MSNRTYICSNCRTSKRAPAAYGLVTDYRCSQCRGPMAELPWEWRIPKKDDNQGWSEVERLAAKIEKEWLPRRYKVGKEKIEKLDKQIATVLKQKKSAKVDLKLKRLRSEKNKMHKEYNIEHATSVNSSGGSPSPSLS